MGLRMIFALILPEPSKAASISCLLASGVRTRPRLSCLRISPADTIDAVDVIASRLRHFHYLRQGVLRATLTFCYPLAIFAPNRTPRRGIPDLALTKKYRRSPLSPKE